MIVCTIFFIYSHCYIELIVQRVKPLQISAWACAAEQFETNSLFRLALCILVFKVRSSCTNSTVMIRYPEAVFYLKKKKTNTKIWKCVSCVLWEGGGPEPDSWHQEPVAVTDTASPDSSPVWFFFFFSHLYTPVGFFWQVLRALPTDVQPLPELCVSLLMNAGQRSHSDVEHDSCFVWRWFKSCAVWSTLSD